jgi:hypothetical protein
MRIRNRTYQELTKSDVLICALGYESRSWFLLEQNFDTRTKENTLIFCFEKHKNVHALLNKIASKQIRVVESNYSDVNHAKQQLENFLQTISCQQEKLKIHFDYSSMPRSWYCSFPFVTSESFELGEEVLFWYVSGDYPDTYTNYPSAGIESISVFSGLALPAVDIKRFHMVGLGYDNIRTETVISITEPESLIACYAYNPKNSETKESAYKANKRVIDRALISVALPTDNFRGSVDMLCELVYNFLRDGQVILVPDGPKPLIMAMSLVPHIINKNGLTCLHISRNSNHYSKIDVKPRESEIYGFQVLTET